MTNFNTKYQSVCGIDIAKNVIQIYQVNQDGECKNFQVKRKEFLQLFENREPSLIGMEACGGSQYWARELQKLGHTVNLMAPSAVKPYVSGFKSDRKDAIGIFNAMLAGVRKVAVKTEAVTDLATLLGIRARRIRARTAKVNMVRGYLMEYGIVMARGLRQFKNSIADSLLQLERAQASNMVKEEFKFLVDEVDKETEAILRLVISLKYANGLRNGANSDTHRCKQLTEHGEERCIKLREVAGFSAVRTIFQIVGPRKILHCLLGK